MKKTIFGILLGIVCLSTVYAKVITLETPIAENFAIPASFSNNSQQQVTLGVYEFEVPQSPLPIVLACSPMPTWQTTTMRFPNSNIPEIDLSLSNPPLTDLVNMEINPKGEGWVEHDAEQNVATYVYNNKISVTIRAMYSGTDRPYYKIDITSSNQESRGQVTKGATNL